MANTAGRPLAAWPMATGRAVLHGLGESLDPYIDTAGFRHADAEREEELTLASRGGDHVVVPDRDVEPQAAEASEEDERWGGGHGVFTHYLLEGIRGAADGYRGVKDGIVSVGELFEYVPRPSPGRDRGAAASRDRTTIFDRNLPMAITGDLDVDSGWPSPCCSPPRSSRAS